LTILLILNTHTHFLDTTMILTDVIVDAGHVMQRCGKSVRLLMHCGIVVREAVKDLDYTYRLVASGKRKCERPGSEEPEPHVALSPGVTVREQRMIDVQIARIDAAHASPSTAPMNERTKTQDGGLDVQERVGRVSDSVVRPGQLVMSDRLCRRGPRAAHALQPKVVVVPRHIAEVKEEKEGGKGKTKPAANAHNPDIKGKTPPPKAEKLGKIEAAAGISSSGSRSAEPQEPVAIAPNYWHWNGGRRRQQGSSSEIVTMRQQEKSTCRLNGASGKGVDIKF
jgi:hypothetical protein